MSNRRRARKPKQYISPEGREHPSKYSAEVLHQMLVADAVRSHPTDLEWLTLAVRRIGRVRHGSEGVGSELAFRAVLDEVKALTGREDMPLG